MLCYWFLTQFFIIQLLAVSKSSGARNSRVVIDVFRPACSSSNGNPGRCVNLSECPVLASQPPSSLLGDALCFRLFFIPGVCCPRDEFDEDLFTQTTNTHVATSEHTTTSPTLAYRNDCGKNLVLSMRVVGGDLSYAGQWPWMAAIFVDGRRKREYWCGGTLISETHILTAAHCMKDARGNKFAPRQLTVKLGARDIRNNDPTNSVELKVKKITMHPNFQANGFYNDIAILKLDSPVDFTDNVKPICLPNNKLKKEDTIGEFATIAGWGSTFYGGAESGLLRQAELPIWDNADCDRVFTQKIEKVFVCAGLADGGKDACQGDSGSPLMLIRDNRWVQYGIVSFGEKCAQAGSPGVYTRLTEFLTWIRDTMGDDDDPPNKGP